MGASTNLSIMKVFIGFTFHVAGLAIRRRLAFIFFVVRPRWTKMPRYKRRSRSATHAMHVIWWTPCKGRKLGLLSKRTPIVHG